MPFLGFGPRALRLLAFVAFSGLQALIALTGNYAFFNVLAFANGLWHLDDELLGPGSKRGERRFSPLRALTTDAPLAALFVLSLPTVHDRLELALLARLLARPVQVPRPVPRTESLWPVHRDDHRAAGDRPRGLRRTACRGASTASATNPATSRSPRASRPTSRGWTGRCGSRRWALRRPGCALLHGCSKESRKSSRLLGQNPFPEARPPTSARGSTTTRWLARKSARPPGAFWKREPRGPLLPAALRLVLAPSRDGDWSGVAPTAFKEDWFGPIC